MYEQPSQNKVDVDMAQSRVFRFDEMLQRINPNGSVSRDVVHGLLPTGEQVRVHQTVQPAGLSANPAHTIAHSEFICVREGTLEFVHNGISEQANAGDVIFVAKGAMHSARNIGEGKAAYFVVSIGGDINGGKA